MINKTKLALGIATATLTLAGALISPQAAAGSKAGADNSKIDALEAQMQEMQSELNRLKAAPAPVEVQSKPAEKEHHDNTLFFRGGFAHMDEARNGVSIQSDVVPVGAQDQSDNDAWYIGAGFDFSLTDDVWGAMDNTQVLGELMFEYKEFGGHVQGNALANDPTPLAGGALNPRSVTVNQFSLTAAPKIKFFKDSAFRPWIIPIGLGIHVVSPPSESITVLNPGMMFGGGADYRVWKDIFVGVDARYHLTGGAADGVNTDGYTAGGYVGIGF
ncbi:MAG: porin family protein [Methylobacter sp.]